MNAPGAGPNGPLRAGPRAALAGPLYSGPWTRLAIFMAAGLAGCVVLPRTTAVYDQDCHVEARHMELESQQVLSLVGCRNEGCVAVLVAAGAVAAASAVVSGTIVVTGNVVYWFEKQGRCVR